MKRIRNLPFLTLACFFGASSLALAAPIVVNNASFERAVYADGANWTNDLPDPEPQADASGSDWLGQNGPNDGNTFIERIPDFFSEGDAHLGMQGNYYVFQNTGVAWEANAGYTLTVGVGNRGEPAGALTIIGLTSSVEAPGPDNTLPYTNANEFLDDPLYISGAGITVDSGANDGLSFTDYTVSFITGKVPPHGNVVIFLGDEGAADRSHFDNVRLDVQTSGPSLVAHFPLDEDGHSLDVGGFAASTVDNVTFGAPGANGNTGTSATFDGTSLIQHDWNAGLNPESFTLTLWAKSDGGAGAWNSPVTSRDEQNGGPQKGYLIYDDEPDGKWVFWSGSNVGGWQILDGPPVKVGEWQHLAISYDNDSQTKKLYVDGELIGEQNEPVAPAETTPFNIGGGGDFGADFRFVGDIDDIGLWKGVLSDQDILGVMESGVLSIAGPALPTPVAHFPLDEDGHSPDSAFVASTVDNVTFGAAGANGNTGTSATFDGTSIIQHDWNTDLNPESFTLTLWAKSDGGAGAWNSPVTSRDEQNGGPQKGYLIYDDEPDGKWVFWSGSNLGGWQILDGPPVKIGEWQHLAISYDNASQTKKLYVDGELIGEQNEPVAPAETTPFNIGGGGDFGADFRFVGDIDDIGLWDVVLNENDILLAMESGVKAFADSGGGGGVNPLDPDGDGIFTPLELKHGLDPNVADADSDNDGDGVIARVEIFELGTLANNPDTDGDGLNDGVETNTGIYVDATNTGTDPKEPDTDGDGLSDSVETNSGTFVSAEDPGTNPLLKDTDGDGSNDGKEANLGFNPVDPANAPSFPIPIGYWPFDDQGSSATADLGPAGYVSTVNGDPEWVEGHSGSPGDFAIKFDGEDDSVTTEVSLLNNLPNLTMAFWMRMEEEQLGERIGLVGQNDAVEYGMISAATMQWWSPAGSVDVDFGPIVADWTHVAVVLDDEGFKVYANGEVIAEQAGGGPVSSADPLRIGGDGVFDPEGNFFLGEIDDVAIWDEALSEGRIQDLANQVVCPLGSCSTNRFEVTEFSRADDGMVSLTWESSSGRFYDIEASPDLSSGSWQPMGVAITAEGGDALLTSAMVESDLATSMEYFRVLQVDPPPFIEQGFEDGFDEWTMSVAAGAVDSGTNWEAGVPTNGPGVAKTGNNAAGTGLTANYTDGTSIQLRSPVINTFGLRGVKLSFSYYLEALESEGGNVRLLEENGDFIQNLFDQPFIGGEDLNTADWTDVEVRLPNLDPPRPFIIEYQFLTLGDGSNGAGWFIDDVRVAK